MILNKVKKWAKEKLWPWLKRNWKYIAVLVGAFVGIKLVKGAILKAMQGKVEKPTNFIPSPTNENAIIIEKDDGEWVEAELPEGVKSKDVKAAGIVDTKVKVEIKHKVTDRRGSDGPDGPFIAYTG